MSSQAYDITLKPLGKFFFGGEVVFGQLGNRDEDRQADYLVNSELLPQQTSLLGVLRFSLLQRAGNLAPYANNSDRKAAKTLVGVRGFQLIESPLVQETAKFGAVKRIGPLAIRDLKDQSLWLPRPLDVGKGKKGADLKWERKDYGNWVLKNYDPKAGLKLHFTAGGGKVIAVDELFEAQEQAGNRIANRLYRNPQGITAGQEDEGFFRQTFYRNKADRQLAFTFRAWLNEAKLGADAGALDGWKCKVTLGGERRPFMLSAKRLAVGTTDSLLPEYTYDNPLVGITGYKRLLLLSDTYLPKSLLSPDHFVVAHPKPFRFLRSSLKKGAVTENFNTRTESGRYTLLERGGVILVPDNSSMDLRDAIQNIKPFFQIGYNHCRYV